MPKGAFSTMAMPATAWANCGTTYVLANLVAVKKCSETTSSWVIVFRWFAFLMLAGTTLAARADDRLIAHWTFDDSSSASWADASGHGNVATLAAGEIKRTEGSFGKAILFAEKHHLTVAEKLDFAGIKKITLSAWVKPSGFSQHNEIFRKEDGEQRVLFSFQEQGRILSLGLNVSGYLECDSPLAPEEVLDGRWHHAAATFDGQALRVYLDGWQIGDHSRAGTIAAGGTAFGAIGSLEGGECFQGALDELRIYREALSADEIARLYQEGLRALRASGAEPPDARSVADQKRVEHLIGPLTEFLPLTAAQWAKQSPEDGAKWRRIESLRDKWQQLQSLGAKAPAEDWTALRLLANQCRESACERPVQYEPVAPYVAPSTPITRDLTAAEAREMLERDWLHQAGHSPSPAAIRNEIRFAREIAARLGAITRDDVAELDRIEPRTAALTGDDRELYLEVRRIKRRIVFKNPALDFDQVVLVDMPYPAGSEWRHETRHRLGYMAVPGGRLLVLQGLGPQGKLRQIAPVAPLHGSFWRPDVSYDGQRVLFCFKPHNEKAFHLYEVNADGTNLRQLTDSAYDDLDPIYLPDGKHILFSTTRGHTYVRCMPPTNAFILARCDTDGKNVYLLSHNNEPDYLPSVMNDGRVVYTRWEYTDKPLWRAQGLWTVNPDGTRVETLWGNQSVWPDLLKDARRIPGTERVMFTGSAHHDWFSGTVGIIDPAQGFNFPAGLTKVTAELAWPESGNGPVDLPESPRYHASGRYEAYYSPYPLGPHDFLVSASRGGKFVLYLMDLDGNRELIYEGQHNIFHALPLKPRPVPPVLPDRVAWPSRAERDSPAPGIIFSNNVYEGTPAALHGKARYLRILSIDAKTYTYWYQRPYISTGPVVSGVQSEGVKRILGTVPVEADGSVAFEAPSGIPLHFQLLDEQFRALQTMRSFTGVMPGERRGCVGCHESRGTAAPDPSGLALSRPASKITPPPWGEDTVSFNRYVRPVLTRYCGECHEGEGKGRATVDFLPRPGKLGFDATYWLLIGNPTWGAPYQKPDPVPPGWGIAGMLMVEAYDTRDPVAYQTPPPMTRLSYTSPLVKLASSGRHYDVRVDPESLQKLIAWVDSMCPYRGDEEVRELDDPIFQGVDWLAIRPRIKSAPRIVRPGPLD